MKIKVHFNLVIKNKKRIAIHLSIQKELIQFGDNVFSSFALQHALQATESLSNLNF